MSDARPEHITRDRRLCACVSGAQFYVWADINGGRRCTNCNCLERPLTPNAALESVPVTGDLQADLDRSIAAYHGAALT